MPLVENPAIRMMRVNQDDILYTSLLLQSIPEEELENWSVDKLGKKHETFWGRSYFLRHPVVGLLLFKTFLKMLARQFYMKVTQFSRQSKTIKDLWGKVYKAYGFLKNMSQYNLYTIERSRRCLNELSSQHIREVAVYGAGDIAEVLYDLTFEVPLRIIAIYDDVEKKRFLRFNVLPIEAMNGGRAKVIIASLVGVEEKVERLRRLGVDRERIVVLQ
jgi:hypothetical protein